MISFEDVNFTQSHMRVLGQAISSPEKAQALLAIADLVINDQETPEDIRQLCGGFKSRLETLLRSYQQEVNLAETPTQH